MKECGRFVRHGRSWIIKREIDLNLWFDADWNHHEIIKFQKYAFESYLKSFWGMKSGLKRVILMMIWWWLKSSRNHHFQNCSPNHWNYNSFCRPKEREPKCLMWQMDSPTILWKLRLYKPKLLYHWSTEQAIQCHSHQRWCRCCDLSVGIRVHKTLQSNRCCYLRLCT